MITETIATPEPVLKSGIVYQAGDRFVCAASRCAGMTALYSGRAIGGAKLRKVSKRDVTEWAGYGLGALKCECGAVTAS